MGMSCQLHALNPAEEQSVRADPQSILGLQSSDFLDLDKSWHGLHRVLTGTAWEGDFPLCFLLDGGEALEEIDTGYGPPRLLSADEVVQIANALGAVTEEEFDRRFDREQMAAEDIYPTGVWDERRTWLLTEWLLPALRNLKRFVMQAARERMAVLVYLT
jgi:hypothetical protein